jgi:hypothetical protein
MTIRTKSTPCMGCGELMTAIDTLADGTTPTPSDGDVAICLYCNHIHIFESGKMRDSTEKERDEMLLDSNMMETLQFGRMYQKMFPRVKDT